MSARVQIASTAAFALTCAVASLADAPAGQYKVFDATSIEIVDNQTGLVWQRGQQKPPELSRAGIAAACTGDWRVPTVKELLTLVDERPHQFYSAGTDYDRYIDPRAFPTTPVDVAFASLSPDAFWTVHFLTGQASRITAAPSKLYVRCVKR